MSAPDDRFTTYGFKKINIQKQLFDNSNNIQLNTILGDRDAIDMVEQDMYLPKTLKRVFTRKETMSEKNESDTQKAINFKQLQFQLD